MIKLRDFLSSLFIHIFFLTVVAGLLKLNAETSAKYIEIDLSLASLANLSKATSSIATSNKEDSKSETKNQVKNLKFTKIPEKALKQDPMVENTSITPKKERVEEVISKEVVKEVVKPLYAEDKESIQKCEEEGKFKNIGMIREGGFSREGGDKGKDEGGSGKVDGSWKRGVGSGEGGSSYNLEKIRENYLLEKLSIISKIVQKNISYPYIAKKMGWEGEVVISFVLTKEGKVNFLNVEMSSGYKVLDENAIKTIKEASKYFPLPPIDVKIRLPISYRLE